MANKVLEINRRHEIINTKVQYTEALEKFKILHREYFFENWGDFRVWVYRTRAAAHAPE